MTVLFCERILCMELSDQEADKTSSFWRNTILSENKIRNLKFKDSFVVYMCVAGSAIITSKNHSVSIARGETVLIPQIMADLEIKTQSATLLEVYIP